MANRSMLRHRRKRNCQHELRDEHGRESFMNNYIIVFLAAAGMILPPFLPTEIQSLAQALLFAYPAGCGAGFACLEIRRRKEGQ